MSEFHGFLFSKLHSIGSRSEGPTYFLQQFDGKDLEIKKKAEAWEQDPALQKYLGSKITVNGTLVEGRLQYEQISEYKP